MTSPILESALMPKITILEPQQWVSGRMVFPAIVFGEKGQNDLVVALQVESYGKPDPRVVADALSGLIKSIALLWGGERVELPTYMAAGRVPEAGNIPMAAGYLNLDTGEEVVSGER